MKKALIGMFDSGIGGLSVLEGVNKYLPSEDILYVGDIKNVPYGDKTLEEIYRLSYNISKYLISQGATMIVIACNTASYAAYERLKKELSVPVVEVIGPSAGQGVEATKSSSVGIIATTRTIEGGQHKQVINKLNPKIKVWDKATPTLASLVESYNGDDKQIIEDLKGYFKNMPSDVDTLVLGCTHYSFLKKQIAQVLGSGVKLVDSIDKCSVIIEDLIKKEQGLSKGKANIRIEFTAENELTMKKIGSMFSQATIKTISI